jgi:hypothetical protein
MAGPIIPTLRELPPSFLAGRKALCSSLLVRSVHQRQTWVDHRPPFVAHTVSCMRVRVYVVLVVLALRRSILKPQPCLCAVLFSATLVCQDREVRSGPGCGILPPCASLHFIFVLVQQRIVHFEYSA